MQMRQFLLLLIFSFSLCSLSAQVYVSELVNDVASLNDGSGAEWFELSGNPGTDISCFQITDGDDVIVLPSGTAIPADGYLLIGNASRIDAGGAVPDIDLDGCGCFSSGFISLTNSGEFLAIYDANQNLVSGIIWEQTSPTSNNTPNGQSITPTYPSGCSDMGALNIVDLPTPGSPPAPWVFTNLDDGPTTSLVQDGKGGVSLSNSPTPGTAPPCSITNFAITEPVCTPGTANSTFTVSFCVVGGSGNYIALNPANNISYGTSGSNAPLNGMVSFIAGGNSGGTTPGVMAEVELINSIGSCSGGTLDILPPVCVANQAPIAVCQNVTVDANGDCMGTAVAADFDGGSTDADGDPLMFTLDNTGPFPLGPTNVMLTVSDGTDSDMCMATITVEDNTPPVLDCSGIVTALDADADCMTLSAGSATIVDNCSPVNVDFTFTGPEGDILASQAIFPLASGIFDASNLSLPVGTTTLDVIVTDQGGNMDDCSVSIVVSDITPPSVTCPEFTNTFEGCPGSLGPNTPNGVWSTLPASGMLNTAVGGSFITTIDLSTCVSDNCSDLDEIEFTLGRSFEENRTGGSVDLVNVIIFRDAALNESPDSVLVRVTIEDTEAPVIICRDTTVALDATGTAMLENGDVVTSIIDNCDPDPSGPNTMGGPGARTFDCSQAGTDVSVTVVSSDDAGNQGSCTYTVSVIDTLAPVLVCRDTTVALNAAGTAMLDNAQTVTSVTDNCDMDPTGPFTMGGPGARTFSCAQAGTDVAVTFVASDVNGNEGSCTIAVSVIDTLAPILVCRDTTVALNAAGTAMLDNAQTVTSVTDNCDMDPTGPFTMGGPGARTFSCAQVGTDVAVTFVASDVNGNEGSCTIAVSVIDTLAPVLVCRDTTVALNAAGTAMLDNAQTVTSVTDNCDMDPTGPFTMGGPGARTFSCTQAGTDVAVTFVASDVNGNEGSCTIAVSVIDTLAPVITCTTDSTVQLNAAGMVVFDPAGIVQTSSDNCTTALTVTASAPTTFDCGDVVETFPFTVTVADAAGNDTTCLVTVTVEDNIAPTFTVNSPTVTLNAGGTATLTIEDLLGNNVTDNCGIADTTLSRDLVFSCDDIGDSGVDVTITDVNGNETTLTATVFINFVDPSLGCNGNINITLNENCQALIVPSMVLAGNLVCLDQGLFNVVVQDGTPGDGGIITGCGEYTYMISTPQDGVVTPPVSGFTGAFAPANFTLSTVVPNPATQTATAAFTATTLTLSTTSPTGALVLTDTLSSSASYMFTQAGVFTATLTHTTSDGLAAFDGFIVKFDGSVTPIDMDTEGSAGGTTVNLNLTVEIGDMLVLRVYELDGFGSAQNDLVVSNLVFDPQDIPAGIPGFTTCWGTVRAEDKTPPAVVPPAVPNGPFFCDQLTGISLTELPFNVSRCYRTNSAGQFINAAGTVVSVTSLPLAFRTRIIAGGGFPAVTDNCSNVQVCVNDVLTYAPVDPECSDIILTRTFTVRDDGPCTLGNGETAASVTASYQIIFTRPSLADVNGTTDFIEIACNDASRPLLPANQFGNANPAPLTTEFPSLVTGSGTGLHHDGLLQLGGDR